MATKQEGLKSSFTPTKKRRGGGGSQKRFSHAEGGWGHTALLERRLELKHNNRLNMFRGISSLNILVF